MDRIGHRADDEGMTTNERNDMDTYQDMLDEMNARYGSGKDVFEQRKERIDREHAATIRRAQEEQSPAGTLRRALAEVNSDLAFEAERADAGL